MVQDTDYELQQAEAEDSGPDIGQLAKFYKDTVSDLSSHIEEQERNHDVRRMLWKGQSDDNRKHALVGSNKQPFPWDGASDLRVPVVDNFINFGVALDCMALQRANIRAVPVETGDVAKAAVVSNFMRWLVMSQMEEYPRERELLANYRRERGIGVLGVFWDKRVQKTLRPVTIEEIAQMMPDVAAAIQQGIYKEELVEVIRAGVGVSAKKAKKMLAELQETGATTIHQTVQTVNRPVIKAYSIGDDIFLPPNTVGDIQNASAIFRRAWLTPEMLREKVISEKWDEEYVERGISHALGDNGTTHAISEQIIPMADRMGVSGADINKGMVEVVYAYRRLSDEDGVPGIYCTVFFPACHQGGRDDYGTVAKHELLGYRHGLYPFVAFSYERTGRLLIDTRGQAETGRCWQEAVKVEMDARIDHSSLSTCPPVTHPAGRAPGKMGPGTFIGERRPGEFGYMQIPAPPTASREIHDKLEDMARDYFGLPTSPDRMAEATTKQQHQVTSWLLGWQQVFRQVWALYKQYGPDEQFFRVIGANEAQAQKFNKGEMDDQVDFYLAFDVLNNDPESVTEKIKAFMQLAQQDRMGLVDWSKLLTVGFNMIDPMLAEEVIVPQQMAAQKEISATHEDIAKMTSGIDLDVPQNANAQLRLQTLQQWLQGVPDNPADDVKQALRQNPQLQKRVSRYMEQLQFLIQQYQVNAQTGRIGTTPAGATSAP